MVRYLPGRPLFIAFLTSFLSLLVYAYVPASNSSPASPHPYLDTPSLTGQLWSSFEQLLASDVGFALLLLPFSLSAFPLAFLLLRKPSSSSSSSSPVKLVSASYASSSKPASTASQHCPTPTSRYSSTSSPLTAPIPVTHYTSSDSTSPSSDFLIVGCGVAGAALSTLLARRGYTVACVERDLTEPHRIVGELMQPGGCNAMEELGLGALLGGFDAQTVRGYTIIKEGEQNLVLQYSKLADGREVREEGRSFHNGRFVQSLRAAAQKEQHCTIIEGSVTSLIEEDGAVVGATYQRKSTGGEVEVVQHRAAMTIVADGCLSAFRRQLLSSQQQKLSSFLGLILTDCPLPTARHGHVILAQPTPILAYPISSTEVRMLIDFPNGTLPSDKAALTTHLLSHVRPQLPAMMHRSFTEAVEGGRLSSMPNQSLQCRPVEKRGVLLVGDSSNMRHPLTGGGMTVAMFNCRQLLHSFAQHNVNNMNDTAQLQAAVHHYYTHRTTRVKVINILADALYNVFCARYDALRDACFHYLAQGEGSSGGPVRLLSGVSQSQALLVFHFYSVALYGVRRAVWPWTGTAAVATCAAMMRDACHIILPLLARENEQDSALVRASWYGWKRVVGA